MREFLQKLLHLLVCHLVLVFFLLFAVSGAILYRGSIPEVVAGPANGTVSQQGEAVPQQPIVVAPPEMAENQEGDAGEPGRALRMEDALQLPSAEVQAIVEPDSEAETEPQPAKQAANSRLWRLQEARQAYWRGEPLLAEELYLQFLELYPDAAVVYGELGNFYQGLGRTAEAIAAFEQAALLFERQGNDSARQELEELLENYPK